MTKKQFLEAVKEHISNETYVTVKSDEYILTLKDDEVIDTLCLSLTVKLIYHLTKDIINEKQGEKCLK